MARETDRLEENRTPYKFKHSEWGTPIVLVPKTNGNQWDLGDHLDRGDTSNG